MCSAMCEFCIDFERLLWWCKQCGKRLQLTSYIDTKLTFNQWELFCHQRGSGGLENRGGQVRSFSFLTNHSNLQFCQTDNFGSNCGLLRIEKVQMFKFWPGGLLRMIKLKIENWKFSNRGRWSLENAASLVFDRRLNWDETWGKMMVRGSGAR